MTEVEQQQIEEPQPSNNEPQQATDQMPLKDQFSSDLSEIDLGQYGDRQEQQQPGQKPQFMKPKKKRIMKGYRWKLKWVSQANIVSGSGPIWLKKWVKVKDDPRDDEKQGENENEESDRDKGALQLAHAIIQGQMSNS